MQGANEARAWPTGRGTCIKVANKESVWRHVRGRTARPTFQQHEAPLSPGERGRDVGRTRLSNAPPPARPSSKAAASTIVEHRTPQLAGWEGAPEGGHRCACPVGWALVVVLLD